MSLFEDLNIPKRNTRAYLATLCNGEKIGKETRNEFVKAGSYYTCGVEIKMRGDANYIFETWTIEQGFHKLNSHVCVDRNGQMIEGATNTVNCFSLGWMPADQGWIDEMIEELAARMVDTEWDELE